MTVNLLSFGHTVNASLSRLPQIVIIKIQLMTKEPLRTH